MSQRVTLDDVEMRARLKRSPRHVMYTQRPVSQPARQLFQDVRPIPKHQAVSTPKPVQQALAPSSPTTPVLVKPVAVKAPQRQIVSVPAHQPQRSQVLMRQPLPLPVLDRQFESAPKRSRFSVKFDRATLLSTLAVIVFLVGVTVSFLGLRTNNVAQAQVSKIAKKAATTATTTQTEGSMPPNTAPVSANTIANYQVAPDLPRYIRIPKLDVYARVLQVGVTSSGALATPSNVFDTAWYTGSAKPGDAGATLIDGHVSSWTTNGVFYGLKNLVAGDQINIEKGDGTKLNYTVVTTQAYPADKVDMSALMKPVTTGKSGLNLITCGGKYDSKSGEFTQRIAVFAALN
jgi:sortase (surface protein transpeptidase)